MALLLLASQWVAPERGGPSTDLSSSFQEKGSYQMRLSQFWPTPQVSPKCTVPPPSWENTGCLFSSREPLLTFLWFVLPPTSGSLNDYLSLLHVILYHYPFSLSLCTPSVSPPSLPSSLSFSLFLVSISHAQVSPALNKLTSPSNLQVSFFSLFCPKWILATFLISLTLHFLKSGPLLCTPLKWLSNITTVPHVRS